MLYGGWSATMSTNLNEGPNSIKYNKLGFDLDFDIPNGVVQKRLFITMSRHSLERLILRNTSTISTYKEAVAYLNGIIKKVILHSLAFLENGPHDKNELIVNIDGFVLPIVFNPGLNRDR